MTTDKDAPKAEAEEPELPPYVIEGARSSRSRCKTCRKKIDKGALRLGILIEGPFGTGYLWHHLRCAARRHFDRLEEAYENEAWNEAKEPPGKIPALDELRALQVEAEKKKKQRKTIPYAEISPTGRARCKHCGEPLEKDEPRIVLGQHVAFGSQTRVGPYNVHPECVAEALESGEMATEAEGLLDALRANSDDLAAAALDDAISRIGSLD